MKPKVVEQTKTKQNKTKQNKTIQIEILDFVVCIVK